MLISMRDYIQLKGRANLQDIARYFHLPESVVEQMMLFWIKKGKIKLSIMEDLNACGTKKCASCIGCDLTGQRIYTWASS